MAKEFTELERGESAAVTKRKHIPTWLYKQANRLTEQMEQIKREIEGGVHPGRFAKGVDTSARRTVTGIKIIILEVWE